MTLKACGTFGDAARYEDEAWGEHFEGRAELESFMRPMRVLPDLEIAVQRRYVTDEAIVVEGGDSRMHLGAWRGLPATGRRIELPFAACFHVNDPAGKKFTTTGAQCPGNWACFTSLKLCRSNLDIGVPSVTIVGALARKLLGR